MRKRRTQLAHLKGRLHFALTGRIQRAECLQHLPTICLSATCPDVIRGRIRLQQVEATLVRAMRDTLFRAQKRLARQYVDLGLLAPQRTLERGYAILLNGKSHTIHDPNTLHIRTHTETRLAQDAVDVEVARVQPKPEL